MKRGAATKKKINWGVVAAFVALLVLISGAVIKGLSQPVDSEKLNTQIEDLQAAISEGNMIAANVSRQNDNYYQSQLSDLEENVADKRKGIENAAYDPSIADKRQKFIEISNQVSDQLHSMSLVFHDPNQLPKLQDQLKQYADSLEKLK